MAGKNVFELSCLHSSNPAPKSTTDFQFIIIEKNDLGNLK